MLFLLGQRLHPSMWNGWGDEYMYCNFHTFSFSFSTRLTNCVVGEEAKIGRDCNLTSTSVARDHKVSSNMKLKNDFVGFSEIDFDELVL